MAARSTRSLDVKMRGMHSTSRMAATAGPHADAHLSVLHAVAAPAALARQPPARRRADGAARAWQGLAEGPPVLAAVLAHLDAGQQWARPGGLAAAVAAAAAEVPPPRCPLPLANSARGWRSARRRLQGRAALSAARGPARVLGCWLKNPNADYGALPAPTRLARGAPPARAGCARRPNSAARLWLPSRARVRPGRAALTISSLLRAAHARVGGRRAAAAPALQRTAAARSRSAPGAGGARRGAAPGRRAGPRARACARAARARAGAQGACGWARV